MGVVIGNKRVRKVGVLTEPNTYDGNITAPDMQYGTIGYARGKKIIGTGKAFEKAGYGSGAVQLLLDENGNEKYGLSIFTKIAPNIVFLVPMTTGDISLQTEYIVDLVNEKVCEIGVNHTATGKIFACFEENRLKIYFENIENPKTKFYYFYGKDNKL